MITEEISRHVIWKRYGSLCCPTFTFQFNEYKTTTGANHMSTDIHNAVRNQMYGFDTKADYEIPPIEWKGMESFPDGENTIVNVMFSNGCTGNVNPSYFYRTTDEYRIIKWAYPVAPVRKRWRAGDGGKYYFTNSLGVQESEIENGATWDNYRYNLGNYHQTPEQERACAARLAKAYRGEGE